jgi:hypothetical protein
MNGATQIINLAAGYLAPELRARRARSFADLLQLVMAVLDLLHHASTSAVIAMTSDLVASFASWRDYLARDFWLTAPALRLRGLRPVWVEPRPSTPCGRRNPAGAAGIRSVGRRPSLMKVDCAKAGPCSQPPGSGITATDRIALFDAAEFRSKGKPGDEGLPLRRKLDSTIPHCWFPPWTVAECPRSATAS